MNDIGVRFGHAQAWWSDAPGDDPSTLRREGRAGAGLRDASAAPLLPGGWQGQERDPGQPVASAGGDDRPGAGLARRCSVRARHRGRGGPVVAARAGRRGLGAGPRVGPARAARAGRGYPRAGKRGLPQIGSGLLTDAVGRPVAVRVFGGNTADPTAFVEAVTVVTERFGLRRLTLVGDRGMITSARIEALKADPDHQLSWITCLRAGDIAALAADDGPLQLSLFDTHDLAEIHHPDYPDERLIACRNPALAAERARKRAALLAATEPHLAAIKTAVTAGKLVDPAAIGIRVGKVIGKYKVGKHFTLDIAAGPFGYTRNQANIDAEAALDGIHVIRT